MSVDRRDRVGCHFEGLRIIEQVYHLVSGEACLLSREQNVRLDTFLATSEPDLHIWRGKEIPEHHRCLGLW